MPAIREYPWDALDRVPRGIARGVRAARRHLSSFVELETVAQALGALAGAKVALEARVATRALERERFTEVTLALGGATVALGVSPELATALLGRVLGRSVTLARQDERLEPVLGGALAALAVEVARRSSSTPVALAEQPLREPAAALEVTVRLDGAPYAALVLLAAAPPGSEARPKLSELGGVTVSLPLVIAASLATRAELDALSPGSAWLPASGALADARGVGRGVLCAPNGDAGAPVELTADGRIVLREGRMALAPDAALAEHDDMTEANGDDTLTDAVLEAPVVVRVELGAVSMPASDWAKLRPGDVIETGTRVAEPVTLRIAGRAVARGELVDIDGELGVRIRELVKDKR
ncbi:MAG TPA: FliM/FliN family flagellar motor switch protein [Polyangiaceae bacterium]